MPDWIPKSEEPKWTKAKDAFKKQYNKEPKEDKDWAIVYNIFSKLGGRAKHEAIEMIEKVLSEDNTMSNSTPLLSTKLMTVRNIKYKIGQKVHTPSGYCKIIQVTNTHLIVRCNNPVGDFKYKLNQVRGEKMNYNERLDKLSEYNVPLANLRKQVLELIGDMKNATQNTVFNTQEKSKILKQIEKSKKELEGVIYYMSSYK